MSLLGFVSVCVDVYCDDKMGTEMVCSWACRTHKRIHPVKNAKKISNFAPSVSLAPHELTMNWFLCFFSFATAMAILLATMLPVLKQGMNEPRPDGSAIDDGHLVAGSQGCAIRSYSKEYPRYIL